MLVEDKKSDKDSVIVMRQNKFEIIFRKVVREFYRLFSMKYKMRNTPWGSFSPAKMRNKKLIKTINSMNPDLGHLAWIVMLEEVVGINAPIVWSLHDQWGYTGGCHCVADINNQMCDKYTKQCSKCDFLGSNEAKDLSYSVLNRKKKTFSKIHSMTVVGVSNWMANSAKKSIVFSDKRVVCLPNPINTNIFKPMDKLQARTLWNLPKDKKLILFGAMSATSDLFKGYDLLVEALNKFSCENAEFVVFGSNEPSVPPKLPCKANYLGYLYDDSRLASLYSACDVMVVPSRRESFGQTASESLSCGTPVVAFEIGGLPDIVEHQINGYLAQPFNTFGLAEGIDWVLNNNNYEELCKNAREKVVREFDYDVVAKKYINLYEEVLGGN
jgi:glycosyltransferase involved in cell wall biosynthesis